MEKETVIAFLKDYLALIEKYQIYISGCGCCTSPYLVFINHSDESSHGTLSIREEIEHLVWTQYGEEEIGAMIEEIIKK